MSQAQVRSGISLGDIRPPRNLAPLSYAIGLEVVRNSFSDESGFVPEFSSPDEATGGDAFGRLILLHDPQSEDQWAGDTGAGSDPTSPKMRMVAYIQADMDATVASDPLLPDVAWDWLTEELDSPECEFSDLGGTVTTTASVRYGDIGGPPRAFQLEMRASWTATGTDLAAHVQAFAQVLANVAGLPPEGVSRLSFGTTTA
ncbi:MULTISPECIES: DUF3000 domain-containing protein [unclassified Corynebacterium]